MSTSAFNGPSPGCTPGNCLTPLKQDFANDRVGIGTENPTEVLEVNGMIYTSTGGVKFPDGTTQTTASSNISFANQGECVD